MNKTILFEIGQKSFQGTISFPEVIQVLIQEGIESYNVDLIQNLKTFYSSEGKALSESFDYQGPEVPLRFNAEKVVESIRASQAKRINYPEFLKEIMEAGVSHYTVYITGKKVIYLGRNGDMHIESFPSSK